MTNLNFDLGIGDIPEPLLLLQFDGLEIYMELVPAFSAGTTYAVNLFTPQTPFGVNVGEMEIGVMFVLDLILDASADINMSGGFRTKIDDVIQISTPMFVNVVLLTANVSTAPQDDSCDFRMQAEYAFNVGAGAGATVTLDDRTWGPDVTITTPLYYTKITDICVTKASSTISAAAATGASEGDSAVTGFVSTAISAESSFTHTAASVATGLASTVVSIGSTATYAIASVAIGLASTAASVFSDWTSIFSFRRALTTTTLMLRKS